MHPEKQIPSSLISEVGAQCERKLRHGDLGNLVDQLKDLYGESLQAIILYGSCLRSHNIKDGVVDLYIIVNDYHEAYDSRFLQMINNALPPNVFYIESGDAENKVRAKYAVISMDDFIVSIEKWFHSYIWSRFAQPARIIYCPDNDIRFRMYYAFAEAVIRFLKKTVPALGPGRFDAEAIWVNGLKLTYAAELRPEKSDRATYITHQSLGDLMRLTQYAAKAMPELLEELPKGYYEVSTSSREKTRCHFEWRIRRIQGRALSILRLMKAVYTFKDCVEYAAWKVHRHTGVHIEITPTLQKYPILFGFNILWRLLRKDALH